MTTIALYRDDFYLSTAEAVVTSVHEDGAVELDQTCFYAASGGQPGDTGFFERADGSTALNNADLVSNVAAIARHSGRGVAGLEDALRLYGASACRWGA